LALAKPCDIYLIDEPSAYLDSEQRVIASRVMKRWIMQAKRAAFIVEHDFIMATYLADKVIVFDGIPAKDSWCSSPEPMVAGMNKFLKMMDITFRRDPTNFRPRINKMESQKDQEQKHAGNYFLMEESEDKKDKRKRAEEDGEEESKPATKKDTSAKEETKESKPKKESKETKEHKKEESTKK
jgi:ATP-binding cassette subfamily E protein 1